MKLSLALTSIVAIICCEEFASHVKAAKPVIAKDNTLARIGPSQGHADEETMAANHINSDHAEQLCVQDDSLSGRKASLNASLYWPDGKVFYELNETLSDEMRDRIAEAMNYWSSETCLTFHREEPAEGKRLLFTSETHWCKFSGDTHTIVLSKKCSVRTVIHEIGHAFGFLNEQCRFDRESDVHVLEENVLPHGSFRLQFERRYDQHLRIPYDLTSVMHYSESAFSVDPFEKITIVARNPFHQRLLFKRHMPSFRDRMLANRMYNCTVNCTKNLCHNGGYMRVTASAPGFCTCDCPPNTRGDFCELKLRDDYYEPLPCGGNVTQEGYIETPDFPRRVKPEMSCAWDITAPANHVVSILIEGFEFAPKFMRTDDEHGDGIAERVEFRLNNANMHSGQFFYGTDLKPSQTLNSDGPRAVIIIRADGNMFGSGLRAKISFHPSPHCEPGTSSAADSEQRD